MSYIPQELLYNISTYGRVTPGLTPQYIEQTVRNLDPNFNWAGEFLLEYYRANDSVYRRLLPTLSTIPESKYPELRAYPASDGIIIAVPIYGLSLRQIRGVQGLPDIELIEVMIIRQRPDLTATSYDGIPIVDIVLESIPGLVSQDIDGPALVLSTVDMSEEDINRYRDIAHLLHQSVEIINDRPISVDNGLIIEVPVNETDLNRVEAALYLAAPRSTGNPKSGIYNGRTYLYTVRIQSNKKYNYPRLLNEATRESLLTIAPNYFSKAVNENRLPTDPEIIRSTLIANPAYDLGSLLPWLEMRRAICPDVRRSVLYKSMRDSLLATITVSKVPDDEDTMLYVNILLRRGVHHGRVLDLLTDLGYVELVYNVRWNRSVNLGASLELEPDQYALLESFVDEFLDVRACLLNYLPTFNGAE